MTPRELFTLFPPTPLTPESPPRPRLVPNLLLDISIVNPLKYEYLAEKSPVPGKITWNFNKFLVDRHGNVVARFDSKVTPLSKEVTDRIEALLAEK